MAQRKRRQEKQCAHEEMCLAIWRKWFDSDERVCALCGQDAAVLIPAYLRDEGDYVLICSRCIDALSLDADAWVEYSDAEQWSDETEC